MMKRSRINNFRTFFGRLTSAVFAFGFVFSLFSTISAFANADVFTINNAEITSMSDTAEGDITSFSGLSIASNFTFHKVDDSVSLRVSLRNSDSEEHTIISITDDNTNPNISYIYDSYENLTVAAGESFDFDLTIKYESSVSNIDERVQTNGVKFSIKIAEDDEEDIPVPDTDGSDTDTIVPDTGANTNSTKVSNGIQINCGLLIASAVGLVVCIILAARRHSKLSSMLGIIIAGISAITISLAVKAATIEIDILTINTDFGLYDKLVVNVDSEDKIVDYGTKYEDVIDDAAPAKTGYTFEGWEDEDGSLVDLSSPVVEDITISPKYSINQYTITFNTDGGSEIAAITQDYNTPITAPADPTRAGYTFAGWNPEIPDTMPAENVTVTAQWTEDKPLLCKKSTTLHYATCDSTGSCANAGYKDGGSRGTTTITFGSISYANIVAGNAFDCDVNGDGIYNSENERFYYLRTLNNNAVLISYTNYEGDSGQAISDNYPYGTAITMLPTTSESQWSNVAVTFNNTYDTADTTEYAARFATYSDLKVATDLETLDTVGILDDYPYLLENTRFISNTTGRSGTWLAREENGNGYTYYRIHAGSGNRNVMSVDSSSKNAARPVIEVPMELIETTPLDAETYTITFDTLGGNGISPIEIEEYRPAGNLPIPTRNGYEFVAWYYEPEYEREVLTTDTFTSDTIIYAKWNATAAAEVNGTYYNTVSAAVNAVPATGVETTVRLIKDYSENISIPTNKNIVLDLGKNTLTSVVKNSGVLRITNGNVTTTSTGDSTVNNSKNATLYIDGANISSTGSKQAVYNKGGTAVISGDSVITNTVNNRAAVHNLNDGNTIGVMTILDATIISNNCYGVYNEDGTLILGEKDGLAITTSPVIQGRTYGLISNTTYSFYDGVIKGETYSLGIATSGTTPTVTKDVGGTKIGDTETNAVLVQEVDDSYEIAYMHLENGKVKITFNPNGGTVSPSSVVVDAGEQIGDLPVPAKGIYSFDGWFTELEAGEKITSDTTAPEQNATYYAHWSYESSDEIISFNMTNDVMKVYYANIDTWKADKNTFQANMDANFNAFECSACTGPNYQECPVPAAGKHLCDQPDGYDTGVMSAVKVYESSETTKAKGAEVSYTTSTNGVIYNMIPGVTYYWEAVDDTGVHGLVKASGERRNISSNVRNVRDLGGFRVDTDGDGSEDGTVAYGKIYRGAKLSSSASDATELQKLGITKEVDLRGSSSDAMLDNYVGRSITNYLIYPDTYASNYSVFRQALKETMQDVVNGENIYFHCKIGTDRTGTMAYFLEGLLGVSEEERLRDYELSYFYGLLNRTRFHDNLSGSSINPRFATMANTYKTNNSIYDYFMQGSTDQSADEQLIQDFRNAMINYD